MSIISKSLVKASRLSDENVIEMRKLVMSGDSPGDRYFAEKFGVDTNVIGKAIRGQTFKHLNDIAPPHRRTVKKFDMEQKSRELYISGMTYNQIVKELGISKSSVSLWCRDLAKERLDAEIIERARLREEKKKQKSLESSQRREENRILKQSGVRNRKQRLINGLQVLTIDDVVHMRRQIRLEGVRNLNKWSKLYGVGVSSISFAVSGRTFKEADEFEPPIKERLPLPLRSLTGIRKIPVDESLVTQAMSLRREDPIKWTYGSIAKWLAEKTGKSYQGTHVAKLLRNRDSSIVELEAIKPPPKPKKIRIPKPPKHKKEKIALHTLECVICEKPFLHKNPNEEVCSRKRCHQILQEYNEE